LSLVLLVLITLMNLRGLRETGTLMAIPVYLFLFAFFAMLIAGYFRLFAEGPGVLVTVAPPAAEAVSLFLILHAFATGCTALTGIEAISNGIPAFQPPEAKNAGRTLLVMAVLMGMLFVGSIGLTQLLAVVAGFSQGPSAVLAVLLVVPVVGMAGLVIRERWRGAWIDARRFFLLRSRQDLVATLRDRQRELAERFKLLYEERSLV